MAWRARTLPGVAAAGLRLRLAAAHRPTESPPCSAANPNDATTTKVRGFGGHPRGAKMKYDPDFYAADTVTRAVQQELQLPKSSKIPEDTHRTLGGYC